MYIGAEDGTRTEVERAILLVERGRAYSISKKPKET